MKCLTWLLPSGVAGVPAANDQIPVLDRTYVQALVDAHRAWLLRLDVAKAT